VSDETTTANDTHSDGLWRWLVGGLAVGGIALGLLIAAYAIGYHRGQDHAGRTAQAPVSTTTATTTAATTTAAVTTTATAAPVPVTPALVARGKTLYSADGCSACHSLTGAAGAGPSFKGTAGGTVTLSTGQSVTADDAYLQRAIVDPDAEIVKGYHPGIMPPAIAGFGLGNKPDDVRALVAFIKSQK
jgi:cytochrome c2